MAARPIWKGFVRFSLVSIPVKGYTATRSDAAGGKVTLNQIHKGCGARIKYVKSCPIHGELKADEIVSGYEYADGQYAVIDPDELQKLRTKNDRTIGIEAFIAEKKIDPRFYSGRLMYIVPDGPIGQKPYSMLHRLLVEEKKAAFAVGVFSNKEQTILLRPEEKLLACQFLNFESELKSPAEFEPEVAAVEVTSKELELARLLVSQLTDAKFDFSAYKDTYAQELAKLVQVKVEGQEVVAAPTEEEPQVVNLMEALQKSLDAAKAKAKPPKQVAPSTAGKRETARRRKTS